MQIKNNVRKRINEYLEFVGKTDILLKDVTTENISGLYDYMRNEYRNPGQIKAREGLLADGRRMGGVHSPAQDRQSGDGAAEWAGPLPAAATPGKTGTKTYFFCQ
jgi:hypothetical protein